MECFVPSEGRRREHRICYTIGRPDRHMECLTISIQHIFKTFH